MIRIRMTRLVERGDYVTAFMSCRSVFLLGFNLAPEMEHFLNPLDLLFASVETFVKRRFYKKEQFARGLDKPAVNHMYDFVLATPASHLDNKLTILLWRSLSLRHARVITDMFLC